jgi:phosphate-selective porin OprO/OprP
MNTKQLLLGTAACMLLAGPAFAQAGATDAPPPPSPKHHRHVSDPLAARLDRMERLIEEQQAEIRDLKAKVGSTASEGATSGTATANAAPAPQPQVSAAEFEALQNQVYEQAAATKGQASVTVSKKGKPTIASSDGKYTISPFVLLQADAATFDNSSVSGPKGPSAPVESRSGFNFRRAQIGVQGTVAGDFGYKFVYDFGGAGGQESGAENILNTTTPPDVAINPSGARIQSAFVTYKGFLDPFTFKVGAFPTPSNLGDATSSDDLLLNERPSPSQLSRGLDADDGRDSIGFLGNGDIWNTSAFLTSDTFGKGQIQGQEAFVGRAAIAPIQDPVNNVNLHLGGNIGEVFHPEGVTIASGTPPATNTTCYPISFSDRPELREWNVSWINTGNICAKSAYSAGIEAAFSYGPFLLQGENFWYGIDRRNPATGATNPNFGGWYVEGSWVITGEPRTYSMATASFTRPTPADTFDPSHDAWGAWELAARYSDTDLDYHATSLISADQVRGGEQDIISAGVNFYPNYNIKFMFDWQNIDIRRPWSGAFDTKYNAFSLRTQLSL